MAKHMVFPEWNFEHELENYILRTLFVNFLSIKRGILLKNKMKGSSHNNQIFKFLEVRLIGLIHLFRAHVMYLCKCIAPCLWSRLVVLINIFIFIFLFRLSQSISSAHLGGPERLVWSMAWGKKYYVPLSNLAPETSLEIIFTFTFLMWLGVQEPTARLRKD